jgi:hypothetical protein
VEGWSASSAIRYGQVEVVKKLGINSQRMMSRLLDQHFIYPKPELIELLIRKGADVSRVSQKPIEAVISSFCWSLDSTFPLNPTRTEEALRCMELLGANGLRWVPTDRWRISRFRKTLNRVSSYQAIQHLQRIAKSGIMDQSMFTELMRTPKMNEILRETYPGVAELRRFAGHADARKT